MSQDRKAEFLHKLHALLAEYRVSINAEIEGDTHGIHSECMTITHRPVPQSFREEEWLRVEHRLTLEAGDLQP